jgi:hypothetical protein
MSYGDDPGGGYGQPSDGPYPPPSGGHGYLPPGSYGYQPPPRRGANGMAVTALIMGIIGLLFCGVTGVLGAIFGHVALAQIKRTSEEGRGMAIAGLVLSYVAIAGWLLVYVIYAGMLWTFTATSGIGS